MSATQRSLIYPVLLISQLLLTPLTVSAEMPAQEYNNLRKNAGEALIIEIITVKASNADKNVDYEVEAKVIGVQKSDSKLVKGNTILIKYTSPVPNPRHVGPKGIPELIKGECYPAFLTKKEKLYEPVAYGLSFSMIPQ